MKKVLPLILGILLNLTLKLKGKDDYDKDVSENIVFLVLKEKVIRCSKIEIRGDYDKGLLIEEHDLEEEDEIVCRNFEEV